MDPKNELQIQQSSLDFTNPETVNTIRATVAKDATNSELEMFLHLCNHYQLDPFRKEIWFIKYGGQSSEPTIMTSRDGYLKIAQSHPEYQGIMSQEVRENDQFYLDAASGTVSHQFAQPISRRGIIVGAWATVKRRGFDPVSVFVNFDEYKGNSKIWKQYPSAMIIKVAESFALKRQFGITGLVTREEMDARQDPPAGGQAPPKQQNNQQESQPDPPRKDLLIPSRKEVNRVRQMLEWSGDEMLNNINALRHTKGEPMINAWDDLSPEWQMTIFDVMSKRVDKILSEKEGGQS
jgi:phage recombination protein Bet